VSEAIPDLRSLPRASAYGEIKRNIYSVLDGVTDEIAGMATMSAMLHHSLGFLWTGFYRVTKPGVLQVGPYQGSIGCVEIAFGKGVCGTVAAERQTMIVRDVAEFPGHISCDARSRSEIVVPVINGDAELIAVLDIDSETVGAFSDADRTGLEDLVKWFSNG
jgi:L-methionine (R)-S-oxide reductase